MFKNRNIYLKDSIKKVYPSVVMLKQIKGVLGSGFIYKIKDEYAYILTNYHVVNGSYEYKTTIYNGETLVSKLVGKDYDNDIAVLRTDASKVSSIVKLGNSENLEVGDDVFAIGSPLNPDYIGTVTKGIVSSTNRILKLNKNFEISVIQTDAAINCGNSGGPLCTIDGKVVGMVSAKINSSGVEGMNFAIPINRALEIANKLEKKEFEYAEPIKIKVKRKVKEI